MSAEFEEFYEQYRKVSFRLSFLLYEGKDETTQNKTIDSMMDLLSILRDLYETYQDFYEKFPRYIKNKTIAVEELFNQLNTLHQKTQKDWIKTTLDSEPDIELLIDVTASMITTKDQIKSLLEDFDNHQLTISLFHPNLQNMVKTLREKFDYLQSILE